MRRIVNGIVNIYRRLGWLDGSLFMLHRFLNGTFGERVRLHRYHFVAQPVPAKPWLPASRGAAIEIREIGPCDPLLKDFPRPACAITFRFAQGAVCLAAVSRGALVGFLWLQLGAYWEDEVRCRYLPLPEGEAAWDFDVYVRPEHRGGLVFLRLWDEANRYLASRGMRWSLSRISAFNPDSRASHARMGSERIGSAMFLSFGVFQMCAATIPPRFSISWQETGVPTFALYATRRGEAFRKRPTTCGASIEETSNSDKAST